MNLGQVYTKSAIADFMVSLFSLPENSHVLDPCFGGGVFIKSLLTYTSFFVDAIEIDTKSFCLFENKNLYRNLNLFCGSFFDHKCGNYDGIIMNPPYVRQEEIDLMSSLGVSKASLRAACNDINIPSKANLYVYFILHAISQLKDGGEMIVIFPNSWQNSTVGDFIYASFSKAGYIQKFIKVNGNPFDGDPIVDVCIIKFIKSRKGETEYTSINAESANIEEFSEENAELHLDLSNLIRLDAVCVAKRGLTTFYNKLFVNPPISDTSYLQNIISSPKNLSGNSTKGAKLDSILIIPQNSNVSGELLDYLNYYKDKILSDKKPLTLYNRINQSKYWYCLTPQKTGDIIFPYIIRYSPSFIINDGDYMARDNFYILSSDINKYLLISLLNNYYIYSQLESTGKNYGNGILKIQKYDIDSLLLVNPNNIDENTKKILTTLGKQYISDANSNVLDQISSTLEKYYGKHNIKNFYTSKMTNRLKR
jgi:predicted RNA methylase